MQRHITPQTPVLVLNTTTRREHGRKAQLANINAAKVILFVTPILSVLGSCQHCDNHSWTQINVEDAYGSHGWNRDDQRWKRYS